MNPVDRVVGFFNPEAGARRAAYRRKMELLSGTAKRDYEGAAHGRRTGGWITRPTSADAEIQKGGPKLRERSYDQVRNNAHAATIVTKHADYIVGEGIVPSFKTGNKDHDEKLAELFEEFSQNIHPEGLLDFHGMVYAAVWGMVAGGEMFLRMRRRRSSDGLRIPIQVQLLEPELVDAGKNGPTTGRNRAIMGIEFDAIGGRRGYWLFAQHPNSVAYDPNLRRDSRFVPADEVAHLYEWQRSQVRGVPWLSPILLDLKDLDDYNAAELIRKKIEACNVGVVIPGVDEDESEDPMAGLPVDDVEGSEHSMEEGPGVVVDSNGDPVERFEPGMWMYLRGGKDVKFNNPSVSAGHEMFTRTQLRRIAAGARIPYELATGDFSQVTFASGKMGELHYRRFVRRMQRQVVIPMAARRIVEWFLDGARLAGEIPQEMRVKVDWTPPRFISITPIDDARTDLIEVRAGFKSWDETVRERGRDPEKVAREIAERNKKFDDSDVILDSDPRNVTLNGQLQWEQTGSGTTNGEAASKG